MSHKAKERVWIRRFLNSILSEQAIKKMKIFSDNKTSHTLTKNPESQNCIKHINVMHYYMQGLIEKEN